MLAVHRTFPAPCGVAATAVVLALVLPLNPARAERVAVSGGKSFDAEVHELPEHTQRRHAETRRELRETFGRAANPRGEIRSVLYPMGNADVQAAFDVFTGPNGGPERVVIVDALPFGTPAEVRDGQANAGHHRSYFSSTRSFYNYIATRAFQGSIQATGPAVLWDLQRMGAKKISLQYLTETGARTRPPKAPRLTGISRKNLPGGHNGSQPPDLLNYDPANRDIVEVSFELDGRRASVLYVQHDLADFADTPKVLRDVLTRGYDAYFEKAPYGPIESFRRASLHGLNPGGVALGEYLGTGEGLPLLHARSFDIMLGHGREMPIKNLRPTLLRADAARLNRKSVRRAFAPRKGAPAWWRSESRSMRARADSRSMRARSADVRSRRATARAARATRGPRRGRGR